MDRKFWILSAIVLLLISLHFFCLHRYGINIPFSDDYDEILKSINMVLDSTAVSESVGHILHGYGYSKPIMLRLISLLHVSLFQELNFKYLVITGNMFLVLLCLIFMVSAASIHKYLIISVGCFIFQPQFWEAIYQSTLSNSVFPCLFFSLSSIYCMMQRTKYHFFLSILLAVLAQLSFGNGILVYPLLFMISLAHKNARQCAIVVLVMVLSTFLYLRGNTVSYATGQNLGIIEMLNVCFWWSLEFIGSSVGYLFGSGYDRYALGKAVSIAVGFLILFFYGFLIKKMYFRTNLLLFSFFTFFILTSLLTAALRYNTEVPGASRYQIQSVLCVLTVLIIISDLYTAHISKTVIILLTIVFPLLFLLVSYKTNLPTVAWHRNRLAAGLFMWEKCGSGLTVWSGEGAASRVLIQSSNRALYKLPSADSLYRDLWRR